jgi:hypothetical protein
MGPGVELHPEKRPRVVNASVETIVKLRGGEDAWPAVEDEKGNALRRGADIDPGGHAHLPAHAPFKPS